MYCEKRLRDASGGIHRVIERLRGWFSTKPAESHGIHRGLEDQRLTRDGKFARIKHDHQARLLKKMKGNHYD